MTNPTPFTKMSGTGNDFIIIDHRQPFLSREDMPGFAKKVCKRMFSVGADGLILIENAAEADFRWQFFNADGSVAEMCGNGARCAARRVVGAQPHRERTVVRKAWISGGSQWSKGVRSGNAITPG